jgi:phage-related protein
LYKVIFYKDKNGNSELKNYIDELSEKKDKDSRINFNKIFSYISYLEQNGQAGREPYMKYLGYNLWELRPINNRIIFTAWNGNEFILLHYFIKTTNKTPVSEIEQAKRNLKDYTERYKDE